MSAAKSGVSPPRPWITCVICVAMLAVHVFSITQQSESNLNSDRLMLVGMGAKSVALIADAGEAWRIYSFHFVHTGWIHLLFNLAFLFPVSSALESVLRRADFVLLIVAIASISGLFSLAWTPEVSAGGSGLVYGTLATAVMVGLKFSGRMAPNLKVHFGIWVLPFLLIILLLSANNPKLDHYNHLGGMIAGMALTPFLRLYNFVPTHRDKVSYVVSFTVIATSLAVSPALARGFSIPQIRTINELELQLPAGWKDQSQPLPETRFYSSSELVFTAVFQIHNDRLRSMNPSRPGFSLLAGDPDTPIHNLQRVASNCLASTFPEDGCWESTVFERDGILRIRDALWVNPIESQQVPAKVTLEPGFMSISKNQWTLISFESPAVWYNKYRETESRLFGSICPRNSGSIKPFSRASNLNAAAIP